MNPVCSLDPNCPNTSNASHADSYMHTCRNDPICTVYHATHLRRFMHPRRSNVSHAHQHNQNGAELCDSVCFWKCDQAGDYNHILNTKHVCSVDCKHVSNPNHKSTFIHPCANGMNCSMLRIPDHASSHFHTLVSHDDQTQLQLEDPNQTRVRQMLLCPYLFEHICPHRKNDSLVHELIFYHVCPLFNQKYCNMPHSHPALHFINQLQHSAQIDRSYVMPFDVNFKDEQFVVDIFCGANQTSKKEKEDEIDRRNQEYNNLFLNDGVQQSVSGSQYRFEDF